MAEKPPKPTGFKGKTTKVCGNCSLENPNRTRTCKGCLTEYVSKAVTRKEKIANMGQTNASHQRQLMEHRVNILHDHHGQHVVIMAFSKHGRGYSTYLYGTPGPTETFVNGKGPEPGKVAATLFDRFMRSKFVLLMCDDSVYLLLTVIEHVIQFLIGYCWEGELFYYFDIFKHSFK